MFRRTPASQVDELDRPLLDSEGGGGGQRPSQPFSSSDALPISPNVGVFGIRTNSYSPVSTVSDEVRAQEANRLAMERQRNNQANFENDMVSLEEQVIREGKERAQRERDDHAMALQLAAQEQQSAVPVQQQQIATTTLMVTVPPGLIGGQMMAVAVPGMSRNLNIVVPTGLQGGDTFHFKVPNGAMLPQPQNGMQTCAVKVPAGMRAGQTFQVHLPNNRALMVVVPPGTRDGDELRIRFDDMTGTPMQPPTQRTCTPPSERERNEAMQNESLAVMESIEEVKETPEQRAEREAFLNALPEDMRAEVLAQETAQKRRLSNFVPTPPQPKLTSEQQEFLNSLPAELRDEVERDLLEQAAATAAPSPVSHITSPPPVANVTPPPPAIEDFWGSSTTSAPLPVPPPAMRSSAPPPGVAAPKHTSDQPQPSAPPPPALDMFQNLSVRGVGGKKPGNKSEEI